MSYTIGHVIYGIPVSQDMSKEFKKSKITFEELEEFGFYIFIHDEDSNYEPTTVYLGIELTKFDECDDFPLKSIIKKPTKSQQDEAKKKVEEFKANFRDRTGRTIKTDKIDTYVVWSNS